MKEVTYITLIGFFIGLALDSEQLIGWTTIIFFILAVIFASREIAKKLKK